MKNMPGFDGVKNFPNKNDNLQKIILDIILRELKGTL